VLRNYTSYKIAFRLTHNGEDMGEAEVDASAARKGIMGWVRLHPVNIAARVQTVVEHFRQNVAHLLSGRAKVMVVTGSRKEAVRWMLAMSAYIKRQGYPIGLMVAFSGEVTDRESGAEDFTEISMNPGLRGRDIREAFKTPEFSILIVANKFQTGFDQPLLCAMYVDRKLGGIQAVQTLSRLNRAFRDKDSEKDTTYVVDFVNDPDTILAAFRQYHKTAELADVSDPNVVLDLRAKLEATGNFDRYEVERVAKVALKPKATQSELDAALTPVSLRLLTRFKHAREAARSEPEGSATRQAGKDEMDGLLLFRSDLATFARVYDFLGQMFDYANTDIEKLYIFARLLVPLLKFEREREGVDLSALRLTHHRMRDLGQQKLNLDSDQPAEPLTPVTETGSGKVQDKHKLRLAAIIASINDLFEGDLTEGDKVSFFTAVEARLLESDTLRAQAVANTREQFMNSPNLNDELMNAIMDAMTAHQSMSRQALNSEALRARMLATILGPGELWGGLRQQSGQPQPPG
jgi:type I restriction enzyme R subunit